MQLLSAFLLLISLAKAALMNPDTRSSIVARNQVFNGPNRLRSTPVRAAIEPPKGNGNEWSMDGNSERNIRKHTKGLRSTGGRERPRPPAFEMPSDALCEKFRGLLERIERIKRLPKEYLSYTRILDCVPMDSSGDLAGVTRTIIKGAPVLNQWSILQFCNRAASAGKFELIRLVMKSKRKLDIERMHDVMNRAVRNERWLVVADLRRMGVPFRWDADFCALFFPTPANAAGQTNDADNFESELMRFKRNQIRLYRGIDMMRSGLVTVPEAYLCMAEIKDEKVKARFANELDQLKQHHDSISSNSEIPPQLLKFERFIEYGDCYDPLLFAAKEGDSELMERLLNSPISSDPLFIENDLATLGSITVQDRISIAMTVETVGVNFDHWSNVVIWAIGRKHTNILRMLLSSPFISSQLTANLLEGFMLEAGKSISVQAAKLLLKFGASPSNLGGRKVMRNTLCLGSAGEVMDLIKSGFPIPSSAYADAAENISPFEACAITKLLLQQGVDPALNSGIRAIMTVASRPDPRYLQLVNLIWQRMKQLSNVELSLICNEALSSKNWQFLIEFLPMMEKKGLKLHKILESHASVGDSESISFILGRGKVSTKQLFRILKQLPEGPGKQIMLDGLRKYLMTGYQIDFQERLQKNFEGDTEDWLD